MHRERPSDETDQRSLSPIIGLVLLSGVVIAASALIFVYGMTAMDQVETQSDFEHAKLSAAQVDQCLSTVAATGDRGADCNIREYDVVDDGHLEVFVNDDPACSMSAGLGSLTRDSDGTTIGYQAGGRFQRTESGSTVISNPQISYSTATIDGEETLLLDISLINVTGTADGTAVRRTDTDRDDFDSCLGDQRVESMTMFVNDSTFHAAWVRFLEDEFGDDNVTEPASNSIKVTASLDRTRSTDEYLDVEPIIYGGVYSRKNLTLDNGVDLTVDTTTGGKDWVVVDGDLDAKPRTVIDADTVVTRSLQHGPGGPGNPPTVTGGVYYGVDDNWQGDVEATQVVDLASVDSIEPIDDDVETAHDRLEGAESVDGETVTAGAYTATHSSLGDVETIDTSDGDVHIGVATDGRARLEDLSVAGDGQVHLYLDGGELEFTGTTGGSEADQLWVYGSRDTDLTITDEFAGVVYKPGTGAGVKLREGVDVTGAIVGPVVFDGTGRQQYSVTFDESLRTHTLLDISNGNAAVNVIGDEIDASEFDRATLSVVDQQVAQDRVVENSETIRKPLDVTFVMDRSGSMSMRSVRGEITADEWAERRWNGLFEVHDREVQIRDEDGDVRSIEPGEDGWLYEGEQIRVPGRPSSADVTVHFGNDPRGKRVDAARTFIDQMNESAGDRAGVVDFDLEATELHALDHDLDAVDESLEANANGGTNIAAGLENAIDGQEYRDEADANRVIVLLSDGENDAGGSPPKDELDDDTLEQAERAADRNITIHAIGLGSGIDERLLADVADETGGQYHHVDNADGLEDTFEAVGEGVTDQRERVIENKDVETEVSGTATAGGRWNLDPARTVSLQIGAYGCDGYDPTGAAVTNNSGTTFEYVDCEDRDDDNVTEVDKSTSVHDYGVYTDGDAVPDAHYLGPDRGWWQDDFEDDLETRDLVRDGSFDLEDGQAVIVVQFRGGTCRSDEPCEEPFGYAIYLFEGNADDELEVNAPDDHGTADDSSNTYVINIVETEIEVGDD